MFLLQLKRINVTGMQTDKPVMTPVQFQELLRKRAERNREIPETQGDPEVEKIRASRRNFPTSSEGGQ